MACSRCGDTLDNHFKPGHECKGFKPWAKDFKPLDQYGNWVEVPNMGRTAAVQKEVRSVLGEQIDNLIPSKSKYRRCIVFRNIENDVALTTTITWKYPPNLNILAEEIDKICRRLQ